MIFKKIRQLDSIKQFYVSPFGLFYLTDELTIPQISDIKFKDLGFDSKSTKMKFAGDFLIIQDADGREILYDLENSVVAYEHLDNRNHGYGFGAASISGNRKLICSKLIGDAYRWYLFDADSHALSEICGEFDDVLDDGKILIRRELSPPSVVRVDLEGNELWKYNFEGTYIEPGYLDKREKRCKLNSILGEFNQLLWLSDISEELFALDVNTGKKVFSTFDVGPANFFSIDRENNRLVSLTSEYLRIVDLSNGEFQLSRIDMSEFFGKLELRPDYMGRQLPVVDRHLVFCDRFKSVIGTVGIDSGQVDWVFDLFDTRDYAMIKEMTYFSDKLYVLDNVGPLESQLGSLHIFDRVS